MKQLLRSRASSLAVLSARGWEPYRYAYWVVAYHPEHGIVAPDGRYGAGTAASCVPLRTWDKCDDLTLDLIAGQVEGINHRRGETHV